MRILVTGAAGFIGAHVSHALLDEGCAVTGLDNLNAYYDPALKRARVEFLKARKGFDFAERDLADETALDGLGAFDVIVHLAAQAGVRYSLEAPFAYLDSNLKGQLTVLEHVRHASTRPFLVYASSSSVYGDTTPAPFAEDARADSPVSLYAATKRGAEMISQSYASLYGIEQVGLRFFTVYGAWGRPDMAYYAFAEAMLDNKPIQVFNHGDLMRDFTWIDDIVAGVTAIALGGPKGGQAAGRTHRLYNIGNNRPERLMDFIATLENAFGLEAEKIMTGMAPGDVHMTAANIDAIRADYGFEPTTSIAEGLPRFARWLKDWRAGQAADWRY
ncbi:NAD-dependent epimerase/dehydratase family protein [Alkalicaulis satelles]|uniref:NAD-dependent epimerase/dehydratase family protein n=1 Tax=Alkalicaulis satelles TaxID=2609175 RepID=A0A5M6ZNA1_9PROT|nr:NAD-dependent epimerase/dehydratase family protein [Alkalicaulis satelles]KAA5805064.1 NAD-dependent epimerase/dehydratase family protein [Alkalicaulis satelles]